MTEIDPGNCLIGYARVSTYRQTLDTQVEQLRAAGCSSRNIYREKVAGTRADRRELLRMLDRLEPGDVVMVTRIDRLARSTFDLFGIVNGAAHILIGKSLRQPPERRTRAGRAGCSPGQHRSGAGRSDIRVQTRPP